MTKIETIMRTLGQLVREIYGSEIPESIMSTILAKPATGLTMMMRSAAAKQANANSVETLLEKIPAGFKDPAGGVAIEDQGPFWIGYYQYMSATDLSATLGPEELERAGNLLFGERWQSELARALEVGDRRVREWLARERSIPPGIWSDITALLKQRSAEGLALIKEFTAAAK